MDRGLKDSHILKRVQHKNFNFVAGNDVYGVTSSTCTVRLGKEKIGGIQRVPYMPTSLQAVAYRSSDMVRVKHPKVSSRAQVNPPAPPPTYF